MPDRGRNYFVLRDDAHGGEHWGTDRLVSLVVRTAGTLPRPPATAPLVVGDLSGLGGGKIPRHQSHRCGRDVDLLFFTRDALTDVSVPAPGFVRYDRNGASVAWTAPLRFDTERNWNLVEGLLQDPQGGIIRVFIAAWLKHLLIDWAREHQRPGWVIDRAEAVLVQPGDSLVHDDHMHVRVACTPQERSRGCVDGGPLWPWLQKDWEKGDSASVTEAEELSALDVLPPGVLAGPPLPPDDDLESDDPSGAVAMAGVSPEAYGDLCVQPSEDSTLGVCWR